MYCLSKVISEAYITGVIIHSNIIIYIYIYLYYIYIYIVSLFIDVDNATEVIMLMFSNSVRNKLWDMDGLIDGVTTVLLNEILLELCFIRKLILCY